MLNKKKIIAIVAFILIGFAMFTFANPREDLEPVSEPNETNETTPIQPVVPVVNPVVPVVNPVVVDNAPVITVEPGVVKVVDGYDYDVLEGVTVVDDIDTNLPIQTSITEDEEGYVVTYTVTDRSGNVASNTRTIIVLDPDGDEDEDHYTNEEEVENGTDFDDEDDTPEYDYNPMIIKLSDMVTESVVYDELPELGISCYDNYYEIRGVTCNVEGEINNKVAGTYPITVTATDILGNEVSETINFVVNKRVAKVVINDKTSVYKNRLATLTYTTEDELPEYPIGITLTKENGTDAGSYAITGTYTNTNYEVEFVNGTYTITKKNISLANERLSFDDINVEYDGKTHTATLKGLSNNRLEVQYTNNSRKNAGTQTATATVVVKEAYAKNYTVSNNGFEATITIRKANATAPKVGRLEANEGTKLSEVTLPEGFALKSTDKVLEYKNPYYENVTLTYCPKDTTNYNCVDVQAKVYVIQQVFTVTFMSDGKVYEEQRVKLNGYAKLPSKDPKKKDYTFAGWSVDVLNTPVTSDMEVVASFTANLVGLKIYEKPNAHFEFKKDPTYQGDKLIRDLIIVKEVYADGKEEETTSYTTNFDIKTTGNKTLVANQGKDIRSINTISYKVIENIAFQTKFEVILKEKDKNGKNSYRETKDENCKRNCDSQSATKATELNATFLEVIEHYDEVITVESVNAIYANTTKALEVSSKVRWSRYEGNSSEGEWYDPVRLATLSHEGVVGQNDVCSFWIPFYGCTSYHKENIYGTIYDDVMTAENPINFVDITYTRTYSSNNTKKYVIRFAYNPTTKEYKAVSEKEI